VGIDDEEVLGLDFFGLELFDFDKEGEGAFEENTVGMGFNLKVVTLNRWVHNNSLWLFRRRSSILFESAFSHNSIILCYSLSFMKKSFDLGNEFTKTFRSSHKRARTQEVNGKKKKRRSSRRKEKEKF